MQGKKGKGSGDFPPSAIPVIGAVPSLSPFAHRRAQRSNAHVTLLWLTLRLPFAGFPLFLARMVFLIPFSSLADLPCQVLDVCGQQKLRSLTTAHPECLPESFAKTKMLLTLLSWW